MAYSQEDTKKYGTHENIVKFEGDGQLLITARRMAIHVRFGIHKVHEALEFWIRESSDLSFGLFPKSRFPILINAKIEHESDYIKTYQVRKIPIVRPRATA